MAYYWINITSLNDYLSSFLCGFEVDLCGVINSLRIKQSALNFPKLRNKIKQIVLSSVFSEIGLLFGPL
jgi:hypothetical protein